MPPDEPAREPDPRRPTVRFGLLPRRPVGIVLLLGLLGFLGSAAMTARWGVPRPAYHDEGSYLLAADTFARGRLTNPPHPFWQHFETFHVLQQPTYASKYPPGQGLVLALGQVVAGHPIAGVWLGVAAMSAALGWMLLAFLPPRWAFFAALLATVDLGVFSYWGWSYWGGSVAAAGGALVFGAVPRLLRKGRRRDAFWLGVGLVVLANSRPFEGLLASLAAAAFLLPWLLRRTWRDKLVLGVVLAVAAAGMWVYDRAVTGDPLRPPYLLHEELYTAVPPLLGQELREAPELRHPQMARYWEDWQRENRRQQQSLDGWLDARRRRLGRIWDIFFGPVLVLPWLLLPWFRRDRGARLAFAALAAFSVPVALSLHLNPHYAAPFVGPAFLLVGHGVRRLALWTRRFGWRRAVLPAVLLLTLVAERSFHDDPILRIGRERGAVTAKAEIERFLEAQDGPDLVLVSYGPASDVHDEWVWNGAEIDEQEVVWARSMGPERDRSLRAYFANRQVWTVTIGPSKRGEVSFARGL